MDKVKIEVWCDEDLARRFRIFRDANGFRSYAEALDYLLAEAGMPREYEVRIKVAGSDGVEEREEKAVYKKEEPGFRVS